MNTLQNRREEEEQEYNLHKFCHPENAHNEFYNLYDLQNGVVRLEHIGEDGIWYNFVQKIKILPQKLICFKVKLVKVKQNCLMMGLCTENGFGVQRNFEEDQSVYYECTKPGFKHVNGTQSKAINFSCAGQTVMCMISRPKNLIVWGKENQQTLATATIPNNMKNKVLYFSILMKYNGDMVDIRCVK